MSLEKGMTRIAFEVEEQFTQEEMAFVTRVIDLVEGVRRGEVLNIDVSTMESAHRDHVFFANFTLNAKKNGRESNDGDAMVSEGGNPWTRTS